MVRTREEINRDLQEKEDRALEALSRQPQLMALTRGIATNEAGRHDAGSAKPHALTEKPVDLEQEFQRAELRIGTSSEDRLRWVLDFAERDLGTLSAGDWMNLQVEFQLFQVPEGYVRFLAFARKAGLKPVLMPRKWIERTHKCLSQMLAALKSRETLSYTFQTSFRLSRGTKEGFHFSFSMPGSGLSAQYLVTVMMLIEEQGDKVRRCPEDRHGCGRWFLASRTDAIYCSATCLNRATTRNRRARLADDKK